MHLINSPYNLSIQNRPQNSDRVQFRLKSLQRCIIKDLKYTKLYSIEFLRIEILNKGMLAAINNNHVALKMFTFRELLSAVGGKI